MNLREDLTHTDLSQVCFFKRPYDMCLLLITTPTQITLSPLLEISKNSAQNLARESPNLEQKSKWDRNVVRNKENPLIHCFTSLIETRTMPILPCAFAASQNEAHTWLLLLNIFAEQPNCSHFQISTTDFKAFANIAIP